LGLWVWEFRILKFKIWSFVGFGSRVGDLAIWGLEISVQALDVVFRV